MSAVLQSSLVVALTAARLRDADESLSRKLDATTVQVSLGSQGVGIAASRFGATERRVLGLVRAATDIMAGPEAVPVPPASPFFPGPSRFAVLGSAGFEIPAYADMFAATPGWRAATLRNGTPDPNLALVEVPTATFLTAFIDRSIADAGGSSARARQGAAFAMGLVAAWAHAVVGGPVARSAYGRHTSRPWSRTEPAAYHGINLAAGLRVIGGSDPVATYTGWWPDPDRVADLMATYHAALEDTYHLEARPVGAQGWPVFEGAFAAGPAFDPARAGKGYRRLVSDLTPFTMREWFGVLTPILLAPGITMLLSGLLLPASSAFITGATITERAASELITLADGLNSITPFIYSMIMWANVDDQPSEPFVNALWTFVLRMGLLGGWLPTIGDAATDPSPAGRWVVAGGMLAVDVYALVRLLASLGGRQPGPSVAFGVQNVPAVMTAATFLQAAITTGVVAIAKEAGAGEKAAEVTGWITTAVTALGLWLGLGLPLARALANGGGWLSWFATDRLPSVRGSLATAGATGFTLDGGAAFDDSVLWHDPATAAPTLADLRYPTGGRPLVKVWRSSGAPELEISQDGHLVKIRNGAVVTDVALGPGARTVQDLAAAIAAVDGVEAAPADAGVRYDLPWPASLFGPADDQDPRPPDADPAHTAFTPLRTDEQKAYLVRHVPDAELTARLGRDRLGRSEFDGLRGVPQPGLADADDTVLGTAADLALLLALGAASRLRTVNPVASDPAIVPAPPVVAGPIGRVAQVFRNWNLDHRRVNEWRTAVGGGAAREAPPPADPVLADGARIADAMGWVPLWRAWLRMAGDTTADTGATVVSRDTPTVRAADGSLVRPTNAQLTAGIRFLLDLPV
ncbi:MAG TPA: hypothetical protein VIT41_18990 [Microlunatus sp.]